MIITWSNSEVVSDAAWEAAYVKFETPQQEMTKFRNRLDFLGVNTWPRDARIVELFCGRGNGLRVLESLGFTAVEGVDVMVRPSVSINVRKFDGLNLPFPDKSIDVAMFVDVLHHVNRPLGLLRDAGRVARQKIIIKDHLRQGFMAQTRLSMMDWMGNARYGVPLPYRYWTKVEWRKAFMDSGLAEEIFML